MARDAVPMWLRWEAAPPSPAARAGLTLRAVEQDDASALGALMFSAYRGTVDDEGETLADAQVEAAAALAGRWGPLVEEASLLALAEGELVAAVLTVRDAAHGGAPLLAFALTAPLWQGRGTGGWLIRESVARLAALGGSELHLVVTRGNPAQRLYRRLGFREGG